MATGPLRDPTLPDRYELVRRIASGGMGTVWCARDRILGRSVAVKLLGEQFLGDDRAVRRFAREARAAAQLSGHPNVVTIYDVGETDESSGRPFIVMEHLAGGSLADALRVGAVDRGDAVRWIREAAAAIDHGHQRGIVHRDIKPGNLLLDRNRTLHVGDFGIARIGEEDTITGSGQLFGTAAYLSPEQALGRPATAASDRYSLAVAAYELLVGEKPFVAEHFAAQARQHIEVEPPRASSRNSELPERLDAVLGRGMAKRPDARWPTATAFADAIEAALVPRATPAEAPTVVAAPAVVTPPNFVASRPSERGRRPTRSAQAAKPAAALASRGQPTPASPPRAQPAPVAAARARPGRRPRAVGLAALLAAALAVGVAIAASGGGAPGHRSAATAAHPRSGTASAPRAAAKAPAKAQQPAPGTVAGVRSATAGSSTAVSAGSGSGSGAVTASSASADALESQGHQLMLTGDYPAAVSVLRQAVAAAPASSLTYAYALYDLGRSLVLAGQPQAAIPVLRQRLQIPNQTDVVRQELDAALAAAGQGSSAQGASAGSPGAAASSAGGPGRGGGRGGD